MRLSFRPVAAALVIFAVTACGSDPQPVKAYEISDLSLLPLWGQRGEAGDWTQTALSALDRHGASLVQTVPADIDAYCPNYEDAGAEGRKAFWVTFLSALARHESTWQPEAAGGGGAWLGLLQISPGTARGYGCRAQSPEALKDGGANLSCGIRIMSVTVPRDGVISAGMNGVAADWGPFHQASKRMDIQARTQAVPACQG